MSSQNYLNLYGKGSANKQILILFERSDILEKELKNALSDLHDDDRISLEELGESLSEKMEAKDGPEYIICKMCRHNRGGGCKSENSMANTMSPSDGLYFNVCRGFSSEKVPISPAKFKKMMIEIREGICPEPGSSPEESYSLERYNMEHLMAQMLIQLGYGDGVKIFLDRGFETPF